MSGEKQHPKSIRNSNESIWLILFDRRGGYERAIIERVDQPNGESQLKVCQVMLCDSHSHIKMQKGAQKPPTYDARITGHLCQNFDNWMCNYFYLSSRLICI